MELAIFLIFALLGLGSALAVVLHPDPIKSTLSLVVTLFATAVLFVLLGAPFIGVLQVLVYTGAIVVLFLFVVMLLNLQRETRTERSTGPQTIAALLGALGFAAHSGDALWRGSGGAATPPLTEAFVDLRAFATELFARYLLTFEIVGVLLLVAVIAAYIIAKRPEAAVIGVDRPEASDSNVSNVATPPTSGEEPR